MKAGLTAAAALALLAAGPVGAGEPARELADFEAGTGSPGTGSQAILAVGAGETGAAGEAGTRFVLLRDSAGGGVWVVDQGGHVARCREAGAAAPRVIDVVDSVPRPRRPDGAASAPVCTDWTRIAAPGDGRHLRAPAGMGG